MQYDKAILERTGIFVFNNAISSEICKKTIDLFYKDKKNHIKGLTAMGYNPSTKNTTDWYLKGVDANPFFSALNLAVQKIQIERPNLKKYPYKWSGLQFQKNEKNKGFFKWHSDNDEVSRDEFRLLAPIFYLNNIEEGGETEFMNSKFSVKPEEGKLVVFPATWEYYHRGVTPKSDNKYIITTFMVSPRG